MALNPLFTWVSCCDLICSKAVNSIFLESAHKHCTCQVRWYIQPWFWWLNENWWTCKTSNLRLLLIPLISGIIIYRSHGSGEQYEPSSLCPFIKINKFVQSGVMAVYALYFSRDDAEVLNTGSSGIYSQVCEELKICPVCSQQRVKQAGPSVLTNPIHLSRHFLSAMLFLHSLFLLDFYAVILVVVSFPV